jgi:pyruvate/2-oxoglutarate dehydrogenase complex dihydrolipoamide dehydrogenase (E3) component
VPAILRRRDEVIHNLDDDAQLPWLQDRSIALHRGRGRLAGERQVTVERDGAQTTLTARRAVIVATGSRPLIPPIDGLADAGPWTNREATTAERAPDSLIVLGGGPVGCEMAQAWHSLGTRVTLVEAEPALLATHEPFAGELVADSLRDQGIELRLGAAATKAAHTDDGTRHLQLATGEELTADELLVAVGRVPATDDLGLDAIDLKPGGTIAVDDAMRVPHHARWLYAIGDVNGRAMLTQAGKYQAAIAAANICNREARAEWDGPLTPQVVFTDPEVAAVGHTLASALQAGIAARVVDADPGATAGASFVGRGGRSAGRIVVDAEREVLIGATFVGPEIDESLQAATFALVGEVPLRRLAHAMPAFPTRSEVWLKLLADWRP